MANVYNSDEDEWDKERDKIEDIEDALDYLLAINTLFEQTEETINNDTYGEINKFTHNSLKYKINTHEDKNDNCKQYVKNIHDDIASAEHNFYDKINEIYEKLSKIDLKDYKVDNTLGVTESVTRQSTYDRYGTETVDVELDKIGIEDITKKSDVLNLQEKYKQYKEGLEKDVNNALTFNEYISAVNTTSFDHERYAEWYVKAFSTVLDYIPVVGNVKAITEAITGKTMTGELLNDQERLQMGLLGGVGLIIDVVTLGSAYKIGTSAAKEAGKSVTKRTIIETGCQPILKMSQK